MYRIILVVMCVCSFSNAILHAEIYQSPIQTKLDYALKQCLDINYMSAGGYNKKDLNDFSYNAESSNFSMDESLKIYEFTQQHTQNIFLENKLMHLESSGDRVGNQIFEKCMIFYHSDKLKKFVKALN